MSNDTELTSDQEAKRQTAMYALMGQPFGFTREDVVRLRGVVKFCKDMSGGQANTRGLESVIERIEALLPPNG